jgi:MFS transporter, SHS family, lactate transporter
MSARRRHARTDCRTNASRPRYGIRATASAFCYHQGAIFGGFVPLILTFLAEHFGTGLAEPTVIGTWIGCVAWAAAAFYGPETKDKVLVPDLVGA